MVGMRERLKVKSGGPTITGLLITVLGGALMRSPLALYPLVEPWLRALGIVPHATARQALAALVTALLSAQSLRPAEVMRSLPSPMPVPARQRYKRRTRALDRPWLTSAHLTPALVRAALVLVPQWRARPTVLVLDEVRGGAWSVLVVGVRWRGRVLPIAWAVLPYPWPKGAFTPTVCALIGRVVAVWPTARPVHLLADRGFPSQRLFRTLAAAGWGWTVRVPARSALTVAGTPCHARTLVAATPVGQWGHWAATYGHGAQRVPGRLVVGRPLRVIPRHQATPASLAAREAQAQQRQTRLRHKHPRPDAAPETDRWVLLFTTHPTAAAAQATYRQRWGIEGSFRDAQGGWDGRHGWDLETVLRRLDDAGRVETTVGLWALGTLLQTWLGAATLAPGVPAEVAAAVAEWTTTGRLSVWARGQCVLGAGRERLTPWITQTMHHGATLLLAAVPAAAGLSPPRQLPGVVPPLAA